MLLGEGGAGYRQGIGPAGLVARQEVHLAFYEDRAIDLTYSHFGLIEAIEDAGFVEERCLGAIEVFRRFRRGICAENATRKADDAASAVSNRKHDTVAEFVVHTAFGLLAHSGELDLFL